MEDKLFDEFKSELERGTFDGEYNSLMGAYPLDGYKIYFWFIEKKQAQLKEAIDMARENPDDFREQYKYTLEELYKQFGIESEVGK
jgi:hypothetical protein